MECRNLFFVFCRLKRAGGVKQTAIRLETGEGVLKNSALKIRKAADLFGLEPPAGVYPAAQDAGIGAGDIEKDAVEVAPPFGRGLGGPIEGSCSGYGKVLLSQVFGKPGEAFFVYVCAQQDAVVFHGGCNQGRFPTRGGAGVEDDFSDGVKVTSAALRALETSVTEPTLFDPDTEALPTNMEASHAS